MSKTTLPPNSQGFLRKIGGQQTIREYQDQQAIYSQGDAADAMFHIQNGNVKLVVTSAHGKQAVTTILGPGDMFGEGCLINRALRVSTARSIQFSTIARVNRTVLVRMINRDPSVARHLIPRLVSRMVRVEEDFADRLCNFSEKRLVRILLLLTDVGKGGRSVPLVPKISQEHLAQMVGTTRSRVSHFMNKFRKLGLVEYQGDGMVTIHRTLLQVMLQG